MSNGIFIHIRKWEGRIALTKDGGVWLQCLRKVSVVVSL